MKDKRQRLLKWEFALVGFLIIELFLFGQLSPSFLNLNNLLYSMNDFVYIALAAIPVTFVIITGGIDVSIGAVMGLSSIVLGVLWMNGVNVWIALLITLLVAAVAGCLNGILVAWTNVQPLVVTLGGMFVFSGIALVLSGGSSVSGYEGISGFPNEFVGLANGQLVGVPNPIWILGLSILLFGFLLHFTRYGRNVFLVGINAKAARYSGINTRLIIMSTYMLAGFGGGLSGVILTSYFSSARSDLGSEAVLPIITAVVLGGTSIFGGKGSIMGTAIASIVIGMTQYGLQMVNMTSQQTNIVVGSMLIIAVLLRNTHWKKMSKSLSIMKK
ncbi:autoinducer 2 import system permease LsrD [Peribacillus psychrosaccharolyticus]|uniref:ABC transporter permease n=1 Tax=Peribacillus psychrosaccharolyticus TaxID=1407 RepID=UPI0002D4A06D|nr:autoinducer 2 import system permease LsrD [Peribacillus psychrosaccharolyticus]MEC2055127.1 autoinducer 2 import system permease LsrD [Peribacillus psychrosaccharolyticus]MED3743821.1 autoinducer 2 import system permease LsrD [Peribacillus psychrosaccharolyticus]